MISEAIRREIERTVVRGGCEVYHKRSRKWKTIIMLNGQEKNQRGEETKAVRKRKKFIEK